MSFSCMKSTSVKPVNMTTMILFGFKQSLFILEKLFLAVFEK